MQSFHIFFPYLNIQDPTKLPDTKKQENETLFFFFKRKGKKKDDPQGDLDVEIRRQGF